MVRGGARIKAGGINMIQDDSQIIKPLSLNISLFQFLRSGYFEKDLLTYCANRLIEYSCIYWYDPIVNENNNRMKMNTVFSTTVTTITSITSIKEQSIQYPNYFINQSFIKNLTNIKVTNHTTTLNDTLLNSLTLQSNKHNNLLTILHNNHLLINQLINKLIIPFILCSTILNFLLAKTTLRLSWQQLPWGIFLFYIILLDQFDLIINTIDFLIESYYNIRLLIVLQFLGRFYCQIIPMLYNFIKHFHSILFIIFTIITLKYYLSPWQQLNKSLKQIKQIIQNILILIIVIIIIINCQYIWTYDLSKLEIFILHERILHNVYKCDFATTWILNSIYLNYIWPILDHIIGDILPCIICLLSSVIGYVINRLNKKKEILPISSNNKKIIIVNTNDNSKQNYHYYFNKVYYQIYIKWIISRMKVFLLYCSIHGIFLMPRCLYYLMKYIIFISKIINHNNVHNHAIDDMNNQSDHNLLHTINQIIEFLKLYEIYLEYYEIILRFMHFIEIPIRGIILILSIDEYKLDFYTQLSIIMKLFQRLSLYLYHKLIQYKNKLSIIINYKFNRQLQTLNGVNKHSLLNNNDINKEIIEMSNYLNKSHYHTNDYNYEIDNTKKTLSSSSSSSSSNINKQTSLINDHKLNYTTTDKQNSSKYDMIRSDQLLNIDPFTLNIPIINIKSKLDWYNFTKHKFNLKHDNSSLEQSTGNYHIFYL
ncbi:hypothetical protein MN116_005709 [Schistosoma mekongi]|uniref:Uncharacterized protein n=1 Tax=Schistosoma mekongi TaxID=38744 RepID=A0AAE2D4R1_SCHME|nr:hypothetical protein MN116_005709 [Schistosoma mekongi]